MRLALVLVLLAGCQRVFQITEVHDRAADAAGDAPRPIDAVDAPPTTCWDATRTGNDDGDAYIDGCDPCPGNPDENPTDSDHDGIPDVCDPEIGANTIVGFDALDALGPHWSVGGGQWSVTGSALVQSDPAQQSALVKLDTLLDPGTWVQVDVLVPDIAGAANTLAGVYTDTDTSVVPSGGITCDLVRSPGGSGVTLQPQYWVNGTSASGPPDALGPITETWISVRTLSGACEAYVNGTLYATNAPNGVNRAEAPALHTSFSHGTFKSVTYFSPAP